MAKVVVEQYKHDHWGECVKVTNGEIEFVMTVEIGPRIIRLAKVGGPNELVEDIKGEAFVEHEELEKFWGAYRWQNMGGHRLWHSPEAMPRSYIPHDLPIEYEVLSNGVTVSVDVEKIGIRNVMTATMEDNGDIKVAHYCTNISQWDMEFAPWCLTVFEHGGLEILPTSQKDTGFLSNRALMMWPYNDVKDKRFDMDNKYIYMTTSPEGDEVNVNAFKIGLNNEDGYALYFNHDNLFVKQFEYEEGELYPDNGCNCESYTNFKIMEIEALGPITFLQPGETVEFVEKWNLFCGVERPKNAEEVDKIVAKYVK